MGLNKVVRSEGDKMISHDTTLLNIDKKFNNKVLLERDDICNLLSISNSTLTSLIKNGKIPFIKFGTSRKATIRFNSSDIAFWISSFNDESVQNG